MQETLALLRFRPAGIRRGPY